MALLDGIIGCWSPSLRGTGYIIPDLTTSANLGTLNNFDASTSWVASPIGLVLFHPQFTQSIMKVDRTNATTVWTVSWWQNLANLSNYPISLGFNSGGYFHTPYNSVESFYSFRPNDRPQGNYVANQWQHVIISENGTSASLFLDGVLIGTFTGGSPANISAGFEFGLYVGLGGAEHARYHGEFILWDRPISAAEANKVFTLGNGAIGREIIGLNQQLRIPKKLLSSKRRLLLTGQT